MCYLAETDVLRPVYSKSCTSTARFRCSEQNCTVFHKNGRFDRCSKTNSATSVFCSKPNRISESESETAVSKTMFPNNSFDDIATCCSCRLQVPVKSIISRTSKTYFNRQISRSDHMSNTEVLRIWTSEV